MASALTAPLDVAALVLLLAALAKLRRPGAAIAAVAAALEPAGAGGGGLRSLLAAPGVIGAGVRLFAILELGVGAWAILAGGAGAAAATAAGYAVLALIGLWLARRRAACGCFGEPDSPATRGGAALSAGQGVMCGLAAATHPHAVSWIGAHGAAVAVVYGAGVLAAAYGVVLLYTELPRAWAAWSAP